MTILQADASGGAFPGVSAAAGAPTESPHAEAIRLVMQVRGREIQAFWTVNTRTGQVADPGESIRIE